MPHPPSPAAPPGTTWAATYPGTPAQLARVRADLRTLLAGCPAADDVILLVSELAANAVAHSHSRRPGGTFTVALHHDPGRCIRAEVRDQGSSWDGDLAAAARHPHGLYLLQALATQCGIDRGAPARTVWFRIDYPRPRPALPP